MSSYSNPPATMSRWKLPSLIAAADNAVTVPLGTLNGGLTSCTRSPPAPRYQLNGEATGLTPGERDLLKLLAGAMTDEAAARWPP